MPTKKQTSLQASDFESLGEKLERFHSTLSQNETQIFEFLMENAAASAVQAPPPPWLHPHFTYKPRGGKGIFAGGSDGLTILVTASGKIIVLPPMGPLPTELPADVLGAIPFSGQ